MPDLSDGELADIPLLAALPEAARASLMEHALCRIPAGTILTRQGEPGDRAWLILSGVLLLEHHHPLSHEPHVLGLCSRGDLLGEVGLLQGGVRTASGRALTELEVLELDQARFDALARVYAGFSLALARGLAGRLASTNRRLPGGPARIVGLLGAPPSVAEGLAAQLARQSGRLVAVTAWPDARGLPRRLGVEASGRSALLHPRGFHVLLHRSGDDLDDLDSLLDSLRQRYAFALLILDALTPEIAARLADDEPLVVFGEHDAPPGRNPRTRCAFDGEGDVLLPPESATERFDRAIQELTRRVRRSRPLSLRWTAPPGPEEREEAERVLCEALGGHNPRWLDEHTELQTWISSAELPEVMARLLGPVAARCPRAQLVFQGQLLTYPAPRL